MNQYYSVAIEYNNQNESLILLGLEETSWHCDLLKLNYCMKNFGSKIENALNELECGSRFHTKILTKNEYNLVKCLLDEFLDDELEGIILIDSCDDPNDLKMTEQIKEIIKIVKE
jgi:hypothetical protein